MTTKIHSMLVDLLSRKMREKGYMIIAIEGSLLKLPDNKLMSLPLPIKRHRPDVLGINLFSKRLCIGEAKTHEDLRSKRTADQLLDFSSMIGSTSKERAELIIGIPQRSKYELILLLKKIGAQTEDISIVILPEELAENDEENII